MECCTRDRWPARNPQRPPIQVCVCVCDVVVVVLVAVVVVLQSHVQLMLLLVLLLLHCCRPASACVASQGL